MGKGRSFGKFAAVVAVTLALSWAAACGTSNDQGISFRIIGFASDATGSTGQVGQSVPLACTDVVFTAVGVENNLIQGIRVDRVDMSYVIPAGQLQVPNDTVGIGVRLGPSSGQEPNNPPSAFVEFPIVGGQIVEFLNDNRNRLPELPFRMIAIVRAVGVTDGGDIFRTNEARYTIDWLDDEACFTNDDEDGEEDTSEEDAA